MIQSTSSGRAFFEPTEFPWLQSMAERLVDVRREAEAVIERYRYLRWSYPELYDSTHRGVVGQRATFYLEVYGMRVETNRAMCPAACEAVSGVPGLVTAGIYLLDANSRILPHVGATDLVLRAHMGLVCPPGCFLRVGEETRGWGEGEFLIFDDTIDHEAYNETGTMRAILMFDFFREEYSAEQREHHLRALRGQFLGDKDYSWLRAAGTACEGGPELSADLRALVRDQGLYFA